MCVIIGVAIIFIVIQVAMPAKPFTFTPTLQYIIHFIIIIIIGIVEMCEARLPLNCGLYVCVYGLTFGHCKQTPDECKVRNGSVLNVMC